MEHCIATSVAEFTDIVKNISNFEQKWFRGQSLSKYLLLPSLFRDQRFHSDFTGRVGDQFKSFMRPKHGIYFIQDENIGDAVMKEKYGDEQLTYMQRMYKNQHNGVPTRLMDFTTNALIALFFCVEEKITWNKSHDRTLVEEKLYSDKNHHLEEAGAVFVVDPVYINRNSILVDHVVETDAVIETFKEYQTPFAIEPPVVDKRIKAQCGKFIYFGFKLDELDSYEPFRDKLVKVQIPNSNKSEILEELIDLGLSHKTIYPDVEGFARYAKHLMEKELNERMNQEVNQRNAPNGPKISPPHEARYC